MVIVHADEQDLDLSIPLDWGNSWQCEPFWQYCLSLSSPIGSLNHYQFQEKGVKLYFMSLNNDTWVRYYDCINLKDNDSARIISIQPSSIYCEIYHTICITRVNPLQTSMNWYILCFFCIHFYWELQQVLLLEQRTLSSCCIKFEC